jgi:hypothetical protein
MLSAPDPSHISVELSEGIERIESVGEHVRVMDLAMMLK